MMIIALMININCNNHVSGTKVFQLDRASHVGWGQVEMSLERRSRS